MNKLDEVADSLAEELKIDLDRYIKLLEEIELKVTESELVAKQIRRAKQAIEVLTGSKLPVPGFNEEESDLGKALPPGAATSGFQVAEATLVPATPTPLLCQGCGTGELYETTIKTSKGRSIRVLQCSDSSCNSQYPC